MISMIDAASLTVFITGATSGFGAAVARRFAEAGARVIATGRRRDRLEALRKEIGDKCHIIELDVRDRAAVDAAVASLPEAFRNVNVVVANAGHALGLETAHQTKPDDWGSTCAPTCSAPTCA